MAATMHPIPTPTSSAPPTPPFPVFPRSPSSTITPSISRNASTSSTRSTATTSSSTSSLAAAPMRPPPIETRTAATPSAQLPSRPGSSQSQVMGYRGGGSITPSHSHQQMEGRSSRCAIRNGPRSRSTLPFSSPPSEASTADSTPERSSTAPVPESSPTTPRAPRWEQQAGPTVTISIDDDRGSINAVAPVPRRGPNVSPLVMPRALRGRDGQWSTPSSPTDRKSPHASKHRTSSVDGRGSDEMRERRISQASAVSSGSGKKPSLKDFVSGEELGRGSYSTVVQATSAVNTHSPTSPRPPRQYAIKIINQAHLVAEKKVKYAIIERDALIRLAQPSSRGHRRGVSSSSSTGMPSAPRRRSNASINGGVAKRDASGSRDRSSVATDGGSSVGSVPLSPILKSSSAGRRPSRSAEPPESVPERSEENRPPSPVREESNEGTPPSRPATRADSPTPESKSRNRRQSLAPSEQSVKSAKGVAHPGVIRLHSTFNDHTSLYFVLDSAKNGELLAFIRKYGSSDSVSARYYAAQLIDTIEFMHEREVIHRDLKPENISLDEEMRIKVTDFGSAKIIGRETETEEGHKRSFVGSADFVSPEVLRNEPAVFASDIWAFGCISYQLLMGKPPFRGATDYLTFQKILKRDFEYPEGFDPEAKASIEIVLNIDPASRPTPAEIKQHAFFSTIDFGTSWQVPAPPMSTGLNPPVPTMANAAPDADIWAVFDDEVSDGGFEFDDAPMGAEAQSSGPRYDGHAAAEAVQEVDRSAGSLELPRPAFVEGRAKKGRNWSVGSKSARTSSSSSNNRTALTGLLETMGIHPTTSSTGTPSGQGGTPRGPSRMSRASERSDEARVEPRLPSEAETKWSSLLSANERIVHAGPVMVRPTPSSALIPSFSLPAPKRRQSILTDFPRSVEVKDDADSSRIKFEAVFVRQPSEGQPTAADYAAVGLPTAPAVGQSNGGANRVLDVVEKGSRGFVVHTAGASVLYLVDTAEMRDQWVAALKGAQ